MSLFETLDKNVDPAVCLCCGQRVEKPAPPLTPERAERALTILTGLGFTHDGLLTKHRAQLEWQAPGFIAWLRETQPVVRAGEC